MVRGNEVRLPTRLSGDLDACQTGKDPRKAKDLVEGEMTAAGSTQGDLAEYPAEVFEY